MPQIRKYKKSDRENLRYIAKETAWESYKKSKNKSETVAILFNDYFTEYESENIFVLTNDADNAVGYIICSSNPELFRQKHIKEYIPRAFEKYPPSVAVQLALMKSLKKIKNTQMKTHLHIDLLPEAQGKGYGTKLLNTLSDHLKRKGFDYMTVVNVNRKSSGYGFYKKYGFIKIEGGALGTENMTIKTERI